MEIKGTAVKATPQYVKEKHPEQFKTWTKSLPPKAKEIMSNSILATTWYELTPAVIEPTEALAKLFFKDAKQAAWAVGKYSAKIALTGIYKVFIIVSTPAFMLSRASSIFSSYYKPSKINAVKKSNSKVVLEISGFDKRDKLIFYRIAGWVEQALEQTKKSEIKVKVEEKNENGKLTAHIVAEWI